MEDGIHLGPLSSTTFTQLTRVTIELGDASQTYTLVILLIGDASGWACVSSARPAQGCSDL